MPGAGLPAWLTRLDELVNGKPLRQAQGRLQRPVRGVANGPGIAGPQQSDLFEQYTRVLQALARQVSLVLIVDDLQWADLGSISLLFHLGRQLAGSRILIVGTYRPEEIALGRDGARHPLEAVVNKFQRDFGDVAVNVDQAEGRDFVEALLDSEPNRLGPAFREMLYRQTRGHALFTIELLRGLKERGDLIQDPEGRWVQGPALDWETLPARVEAVIAERIGRLAEAQARAGNADHGLDTLDRALALVEQTGERYWEAELHRLRAELLLVQGDEAEAEASLYEAVEVARRQQAKSWELRATTSLARMWQMQGRMDEARQTLAKVYGWFTEGFDTPDLQEAKALLEELA
jgi:tetratricopeptide (TPR) repeat protein